MNASQSAGAERREHTRHVARFVLSIETATRRGRFGIAKNASAGGVLFNTPSHFDAGEELMLTILFLTRMPMRVKANIVRVENANGALPWRCIAAAKFESAQPELESLLAGLSWD